MAGSEHGPPGYAGSPDDPRARQHGLGDDLQENEQYVPQPLTQELREELRRRNGLALFTPITGTTPEAMAFGHYGRARAPRATAEVT